jgi:steroid delta-isomerase-like uncharacterized protein
MPTETDQSLRARRETIVSNHMADENTLEFDKVLSTFPHPRYEIIPTGAVYDGNDEVNAYYRDSRTAFPDQRNEIIALRHAEDAVVVEFWLRGTHRGPFRGLPPTGNTFECRMAAFFIFEGERLVCERVYFDSMTMLRQLLKGISWKKPSGLVTLVKMLRGVRKGLA